MKESTELQTTEVFCANCQDYRDYRPSQEQQGETAFTCPQCGRFLKVPAKITERQLEKILEEHAQANRRETSSA